MEAVGVERPSGPTVRISSVATFVMFLLSFIPIRLGGALLAFDFFSLLIVVLHLERFMHLVWRTKLLVFMILLVVSGALTAIFSNANEFAFVVRMNLVVLDASAMAILIKNNANNLGSLLTACALAYYVAFVVFLAIPGLDQMFYFESLKSWVSVFPFLLVIAARVRGWKLMESTALAGCLVLALTTQSRTLLLVCLLYVLHAYLTARPVVKLFGFAFLILGGILLSQQTDELIAAQEHSNTFRSVMIMKIFDFSGTELSFGSGLDVWQEMAYRDLQYLPNAEHFFESANPHFLPAELIIRGGIFLLLVSLYFLFSLMRKSITWQLGGVLIVGTCFTTNTGVERLMLSLGIFIVMIGDVVVPRHAGRTCPPLKVIRGIGRIRRIPT